MKLPLFLTLFTFTSIVFAQERKILGRIMDQANGKPVKGVEVTIEGTRISATTNFVGFFELQVNYSKHERLKILKPGYAGVVIDIPKSEKFVFTIDREYFPLQTVLLREYPKKIEDIPVFIPTDPATIKILNGLAQPPEGFPRFNAYLANSIVEFDTKEILSSSTVKFTIDTLGKAIDVIISSMDSSARIKAPIVTALQKMPAWTPLILDGKKTQSSFAITVVPRRAEIVETLYKEIKKGIWDKGPVGKGYMDVTFLVDENGQIKDFKIIHDLKTMSKDVKAVITSISSSDAKALVDAAGTNLFLFSTDVNVKGERPDRPKIDGAYSFPVLEITREVEYGRVKIGTVVQPIH